MCAFEKWGKFPDNKRKALFKALSNYKNGQFQNLLPTPSLVEGQTIFSVLRKYLRKHPDTAPKTSIPSIVTNLHQLDPTENVLVWFGHSSYFIQLDGMKFLIDPIFSGNASPFAGSVKAFPGSNNYQAADIPSIDVLFISHDHWDHLDFKTIRELKPKVNKVICGLGVAQHFEYWGWDRDKLIEKNWYDTFEPASGFQVTFTPARHFSGRSLNRNISLWTSFVLQTPSRRIFIGGDSGYGPHFKTIGEQYGPFDLAILECGQYNENWPYIHSRPAEVLVEAEELHARSFMPVHHSKFRLAQHPWYEPLQQTTALANAQHFPIVTPRIGEKVDLNHLEKSWDKWWEALM